MGDRTITLLLFSAAGYVTAGLWWLSAKGPGDMRRLRGDQFAGAAWKTVFALASLLLVIGVASLAFDSIR